MLKIKQRNKKIKLMHIVFSLDTGGLEKLIPELVKRVDSNRFDCSVCCLTKKGALSQELTELGARLFYLNKKEGVDYLLPFRLKRLLRKEKVDIVHTHDNSTVLYGTIAAKLARIPLVVNTEHGGVYFETGRKRLMNRFLWGLNDKVVCVSEQLREDLLKMGLSDTKSTVISNGINFNKFDIELNIEAKRRELGFNKADFIICAVGRLSREKNQEMLINAAKSILEEIPQAKFLIVGDGPLKNSLQSAVHSQQLEKYVEFLGNREDVPEILKISDCFVLTSNYESFGLVILEAMNSGVPVIATNAGGVSSIVINNENGFLIPKEDVAALGEAVLRIKKDLPFAKSLALKAKELMRLRYDIDKMVNSYEKLYFHGYNKVGIKAIKN